MSGPADQPLSTAEWAKSQACALGFDLVGIAPAKTSDHADYLREWLASGQNGNMQWMNGRVEERLDVDRLLPGARSIICVAANYHFTLAEPADEAPRGKIARYALGDDYHELFKGKLYKLADAIRERFPDATTKCAVDTAPVLEREHHAAAGVGWIGKNTCVLHPRVGSWLLLGELITTLELAADRPMEDHCGTCTRCIDACPTGAIVGPQRLDARKCISYLNLEHRAPLSDEQKVMLGEWLVGCDICQDVCPFNRKAPEGTTVELRPRFAEGSLRIEDVLNMTEDQYRSLFRNSAVKRIKLPVLKEIAKAVSENLAKRKGEKR